MSRINLTVDELTMLQDAANRQIDNIIDEADQESDASGAIKAIQGLRDLNRRIDKVVRNAS